MRRVAGVFVLLSLGLPGRAPAADLEQVISHEHPFFKPPEARLTVGRDGRVYLAVDGKSGRVYGFVLRLTREGKEKFGAEGFPAQGGAADNPTANKDGGMAQASPVYGGHKVALYDVRYRLLGGVDDFDPNSYAPRTSRRARVGTSTASTPTAGRSCASAPPASWCRSTPSRTA